MEVPLKFLGRRNLPASSAGQDAQLYGSQDGRRYSVTDNLWLHRTGGTEEAAHSAAVLTAYRSLIVPT